MKSFNCVINFFIKNKLISFCFLVLLVISLITVPRIFAELQPVKSVEILSEKSNYNDKEAGSFKIDKSAKWVSRGIAEIKFDLDTVLKTNNKYTDILFVLDISGSMSGDKLSRVKADTTELITTLLSNSNNRAGLISFDSVSEVLSDFTNDKDSLLSKVNSLSTNGATNYYK
ncbi:MAG: VWA domain-containing protein, partial [Bacilli bacterium]|nr:VWA domain-containing protein [Bacilli bacterium]